MFLPIGDEPNPTQRPLVTYALVAVNAAIFLLISLPLMTQRADLTDPATVEYVRYIAQKTGVPIRALLAQVSAYDVFVFEHGFKPASPGVADLFFSLFLHAGWMHLLGNMLFLWIFGDNVEAYLGRIGYAITYLATGVTATGFFALFQLDSMTPLVGASGAISGVLGCYFVWFPHNRVRILMVLLWFIDVIYVPARWVLGFYLVIENLLPFLIQSTSGGVAYGAHIGGFLGGLGVASVVHRRRQLRGRSSPGAGWQRASQQGAVADGRRRIFARPVESSASAFERAIEAGRWREALESYTQLSGWQRSRLDAEDVLQLADELTERHAYQDALGVLQRFIVAQPTSSALARAHLRAGLILWRGLHRLPAAYQHFLDVLDVDPEPQVEQAARRFLQELELSNGGT